VLRAAARSPAAKGRIGPGFRRQGNIAIGAVPAIVRAISTAGAGKKGVRAKDKGDGEMFVTPAFAQGSPFAGLMGGDNMLMQLLPFVLIFVIMYFLILRPQQKRAKEHQELVKNLRRGDTVITSGGLMGKVTKVVDDEQIEVEIADGVRVRQVRSMVSGVRVKGEPVKDEAS
jgi:preprotein translocase subunit YajC